MSTDYLHRATIAVPEQHRADANALAVVCGESVGDLNTFGPGAWQDDSGNRYTVCSAVVKPVFQEIALSGLKLPAFAPGAHLAAARRAQGLLAVNDGVATPGRIAVVLGPRTDSPQDHLAALGLTRIPSTDPE